MPQKTEKPKKLRDFARSKRSRSRDKENPESCHFFDFNFSSPTVKPRENRPRASELHPSKTLRLVPYSDSETSQDSSSSSNSTSGNSFSDLNESDPSENGQNVENEFVFAAAINPYAGSNKPKLSGYDRTIALGYAGKTAKKRIEAYVRDKHPAHAAYLDAADKWKTECFIKGKS